MMVVRRKKAVSDRRRKIAVDTFPGAPGDSQTQQSPNIRQSWLKITSAINFS